MSAVASSKAVLWRDRLIIVGVLATLTALAWLYVVGMAGSAHSMHTEMSAPHAHAWGVSGFLSAFAMGP